MVGVSFIGLVAVFFQLSSVAESNRLQARSVELSNRPWVWVRSARMPKFSPAETIVDLTVTNTGRNPATNLMTRVLAGSPEDTPSTSIVEDLPPGSMVGPGQDATFRLIFRDRISEELLSEIKSGTKRFLVRREIVYKDEFSEAERVYPVCLLYVPGTDNLAFCVGPQKDTPGDGAE